jgi:hypothetical protein
MDLAQIRAVWVFLKASTFTIDQVRTDRGQARALYSSADDAVP